MGRREVRRCRRKKGSVEYVGEKREGKHNIQGKKKVTFFFFPSSNHLFFNKDDPCGEEKDFCPHSFTDYWALRPPPFPVSSCDAGLSPSSQPPHSYVLCQDTPVSCKPTLSTAVLLCCSPLLEKGDDRDTPATAEIKNL